jgi:hypothetical protein
MDLRARYAVLLAVLARVLHKREPPPPYAKRYKREWHDDPADQETHRAQYR